MMHDADTQNGVRGCQAAAKAAEAQTKRNATKDLKVQAKSKPEDAGRPGAHRLFPTASLCGSQHDAVRGAGCWVHEVAAKEACGAFPFQIIRLWACVLNVRRRGMVQQGSSRLTPHAAINHPLQSSFSCLVAPSTRS